MALYTDSLPYLDLSVRRKFKKVFDRLEDHYQIRTPVYDEVNVAQVVIEGPCQSWLMLGYHPENPNPEQLSMYLRFNRAVLKKNFSEIAYLAVTDTGASMFDIADGQLTQVTVIEKKVFFDEGHELIRAHLVETTFEQYHWMLRILFSETHIKAACTSRRESIDRNNSANLEHFFLDYDQEYATKLDMFGETPAPVTDEDKFSVRLINGVAGCGKTLILINRAILYCKKYPDKEALLIIHNKPIVADIQYKFEEFLGGKPRNLTIRTFHSFALSQKSAVSGYTKALFFDADLAPLKEAVFIERSQSFQSLTLSDSQIWEEIEYINEHLIENELAYLEYERHGRGFALQRSQRHCIWKLYEVSMTAMACKRNGYLPSLYIRELGLSAVDTDRLKKYDHIMIDEAQFFFPSWLQLTKKSIADNGMLFICADPNQGFLKSRLSWKRVGLNVRGRTKKLNYSYRTTYEILVAANTLLDEIGEDSEDFIKPNLEKMTHGSKPRVIYSNTPQDEEARFLNEIKACVAAEHVPLHQVMVLCAPGIKPWVVKRSLDNILGLGNVVNCNDPEDLKNNLGDKIRLMSINSCTGMESGVTFVLGVGNMLLMDNNVDLNDDEKAVARNESLRKLYVAMTRAGQKLVLLSTGKLPKRVEELMDVDNSI